MRYCRIIFLSFALISSFSLNGQEFVITPAISYADGLSGTFNRVGPGDTVWISSGTRGELRIANFHGEPGNPVVFANLDGQVVVETDFNYGLSFGTCSFFKLSGQRGDGYTFGIWVRRVSNISGMGISVGGKSTDFEIENCEISNVGFAGIMAKTDPSCLDPSICRSTFTQYNTLIHDCYVHDVDGEGLYVGSSFYGGHYFQACDTTILPPVLVGTKIYDNRIERTGFDGIQVSSAVEDCEIHHNTLIDCSYRMRSGQMSGIIIGGGTRAKCFNNRIIDSYATGILIFGKGGTEVFNNLIVRPGKRCSLSHPEMHESGIFLADKSHDEKTFYGIYNNTIIQPKSDGIRIDRLLDFEVRIFNNAIIDPGAYDVYEQDNTDRTGYDSYVFEMGSLELSRLAGNFFVRDISSVNFANVTDDDFHLTEYSPMIDTGVNLWFAGVKTDLDDQERPREKAFDTGAYEYLAMQSADETPGSKDFTISDIRVVPGRKIALKLIGGEAGYVRISLTDLLGRILFENQKLKISPGNNELLFPANAGGMIILHVESVRLSYASKIILL